MIVEEMDRVIGFTTFEEDEAGNAELAYWLSRPPEERIAEVERLRREYFATIREADPDGVSQRLCRTLLVVEREHS
jgi:hypothetical protein